MIKFNIVISLGVLSKMDFFVGSRPMKFYFLEFCKLNKGKTRTAPVSFLKSMYFCDISVTFKASVPCLSVLSVDPPGLFLSC